MTLDEALRELGVGPRATSDEARRAYLRLLKTRKPEVDQAGFLRLREAYELAKEDLAWREKFRSSMVFAEEEVVRSSRREGAAQAEAEAAASAATPPPPPPATNDEAPFLAHAALDTRPDEPPSPPPEREHEREREREREPEREPERERDPEREPDLPTLSEIERLLAANKPKGAAAHLRTLYEAASTRPAVALPSVFTTFDLLLRLHQMGAVKSADRLRLAFQRWMDATGEEARVLQNHAAALWTILRELSLLPDTLSFEVRAAIARAARQNDLSQARRPLAEFAMRVPIDAASDLTLLRARAPVLAATVGDALARGASLSPRAVQPAGQPGRRGWAPFAAPVVILLGLLRVCAATGRSSSVHDINYSTPIVPTMAHGDPLTRVGTEALMLQTNGLVSGDKELESAARAVYEASRANDCATAQAAMPALRAAVGASDGGALPSRMTMNDRMARIEASLAEGCPIEEASVDPDTELALAFAKSAREAGVADAGRAKKKDGGSKSAAARAPDAGDSPCGGAP